MSTTLKDQAAIVGIGQTEFSKNSGRSELQLACEAVRAAIADAGLKPSDVDGMTTFTIDTSDDIEMARSVGIGDLTFFSRIPHGGGAALGVLQQAAMAVATGAADVRRLLPRPQRPLRPALQPGRRGRPGHQRPDPLELVHALRADDAGHLGGDVHAALHARDRHQRARDLAQVAVSTRKHAVNNPDAFFYQRRSRSRSTRPRA